MFFCKYKMTNFVMNINVMKNIINIARKEKGIKINELAAEVGIDSSLMSRILSNKRKPSKDILKKIATTLEIDFNTLLKDYLSDKVYKVLREYPQLASEVLQVAEERVAYLSSNKKFKTIDVTDDVKQILDSVDKLHHLWNKKKPLDVIQLEKLNEYFNTAYTFESNRIEGNTLTLQETHLVVNEGITIGGKSMREHLEAINHKEAIHLVYDLVNKNIPFNEYRLKQIHQIILKGIDDRNAGAYRSVPVRISGSEHVPAEPYMIDKLMEDYFIFYETKKDQLHPVILAAEMHERLVTIHPFIDGNGRTSRLIMNLILLQNGYTIANLKGSLDDRMNYYRALEKVQVNHENDDFYYLIANRVFDSIKEHVDLAG